MIESIHEYRIASDDGAAIRDPAPADLPSFTLTGAVRLNSLLPMPIGTRSLRNPRADNLELNPLGTMRIKPQFVKISSSGVTESHVPNVRITKEAPNYQIDS